MTGITVVSGELVHQLLSMEAAISVVHDAMIAISAGRVVNPPRSFPPMNENGDQLGLMPGAASDLPVYGSKIINIHRDNKARDLPTIQGMIVLFDKLDGQPRALVDAASITAIRTAAASGLASRLLARKDANSHGIVGTGVQARFHAEAVARAVPSISQIAIWGRDNSSAAVLADELSAALNMPVEIVSKVEEAAGCDIVSTVTGAKSPILKGEWLQPGAHVNLVGSHEADKREADTFAIQKAAVYVDQLEAAMREAGDLLIPIGEGKLSKSDIVGEIGELANGDIQGRTSNEDITLYKSLGLFAQDLFSAWEVYRLARKAGLGQQVAL